MKNLVLILILSSWFISCQEHNQKAISVENKVVATSHIQALDTTQQEGQNLFKQYCISCHLTAPDSSKKDKILAPPIGRVVEHYKGTFSDKTGFVNAVVNWANQPNQEAVLMPGAARKFGLMPPMPIGNDNLEKIANYMFATDFGQSGEMNHKTNGKLQLDDGKKWTLEKNDVDQVHQAISLLRNTNIKDVTDYQQTGKKVFSAARKILLNKKYEGKTLQQVQVFFHQIEDDMHHLMSVKTKVEGEKYRKMVLNKMMKFDSYFSSKE